MGENRTIDPFRFECESLQQNCSCKYRFLGEYCQTDLWVEVPITQVLTITTQAIAFLTCFGIFAYSVAGLWRRVYFIFLFNYVRDKSGKSLTLKLAFWPVYMMLASTVLKVVFYIDPFGLYLLYPINFALIIYYLYVFLIINSSILAIASWCDVVESVKYLDSNKI